MRSQKGFIYFGILATIVFSYSTFFLPDELFISIAKEDSFFETFTALLFIGASAKFLLLFFRKKIMWEKDQLFYNTYLKRIFFLLLGLMFLVCFGEEISWGQRIVGYETPQAIQARNMQNEFNIHNLDFFHHWEEGKQHKSGIKSLFTAKRLFIYIFILYLLIIPLLVNKSEFFKSIVKQFYLPVPPGAALGMLFLLNIIIYISFKAQYGYIKTVRVMSEVEEFNMALILFFLPYYWIRVASNERT